MRSDMYKTSNDLKDFEMMFNVFHVSNNILFRYIMNQNLLVINLQIILYILNGFIIKTDSIQQWTESFL